MYDLHTVNDEGSLVETPLPLGDETPRCSLRLRALPGATAIHLTVSDDDDVRLRAEVPADENESVLLRLELVDSGRLVLTSPGRHVLTLAPDRRYAPPMPIRVPPSGSPLDLALVIDATARLSERQLLLADPQAWASHVEQLVGFVESLRPHFSDVRLAVVAFGDEPPPRAKAADLLPSYSLYPPRSEVTFETPGPEELRGRLSSLPSTSGGDFVDAVADAFAACRKLRWRPEARKLLVLFGDSPGHSILHPVPSGGDACIRALDVEHQAMRLHHEEGVTIMTIHLEPDREDLRDIDFKRELVEFAGSQYRRLASRPEMALVTSSFNAAQAAQTVLGQTGRLGREAAWGELIELTSGPSR